MCACVCVWCVLKPTGCLLVCHKMFIWHKILCLCMGVCVHTRECYSNWVCLLVCHRMFIWRKILCLPENHAAYGALVDKGVHSAYDNLHKAYPIKSSKLLRILQRLVLLHIICTQTLSYVHRHCTLSCMQAYMY